MPRRSRQPGATAAEARVRAHYSDVRAHKNPTTGKWEITANRGLKVGSAPTLDEAWINAGQFLKEV